MDRRASDKSHGTSNADAARDASAAGGVGRSSLSGELDERDGEVEWEAVAEHDVGSQLSHLGKASGGGDTDANARSAADADEDKEEAADEEGEGEVDTRLAPNSDSGGEGAPADDADEDDDDADDDDRGAGRMQLRAVSASAAGGPTPGSSATARASDKWQDQITSRDEQRDKIKRQPKQKNPDTNAFNSKQVKANHLSKDKKKRRHQIDRAGVRFRDEDKFAPIHKRVDRYRISDSAGSHAGKSVAVKLPDGNDAILSKSTRLAINPAHSRRLVTDQGVDLGHCVLTWHGGRQAAWMQLSMIKLATTKTNDPRKLKKQQTALKRAVNRRANAWKSKIAGKKALSEAAEFKFGGNGARPRDVDQKRYIVPNQKSANANRVSDYLVKPDDKTFNVMLNLPRDRQAPIAVDTARRDEDHFFVPHTGGVVQEVSIYKRGPSETKVRARQTWVFGHLGYKGDSEPDPSRRGWVPLRVLDPVK